VLCRGSIKGEKGELGSVLGNIHSACLDDTFTKIMAIKEDFLSRKIEFSANMGLGQASLRRK
jgi:hypothetical protein